MMRLLKAMLLAALFGPSVGAEPVKFPLMAWDYADDPVTLKAMAECGITSVEFVPPKALDACRDAGIGAVVFDERISGGDWTKPFDGDAAVRNLPAVIKEIGDHPAIIGYHIRDEPGPGEYPELAKAVAAIKEQAPGKWSGSASWAAAAEAEPISPPSTASQRLKSPRCAMSFRRRWTSAPA